MISWKYKYLNYLLSFNTDVVGETNDSFVSTKKDIVKNSEHNSLLVSKADAAIKWCKENIKKWDTNYRYDKENDVIIIYQKYPESQHQDCFDAYLYFENKEDLALYKLFKDHE
jgi:hypothetical protein